MKKTLILTAAAALMLLGCSKEQEEVIELSHNVEGKKITVGVSFEVPETSTKSDIDDNGKFYWSVEDAILIGSNETKGTNSWGQLDIVSNSQNEKFGPGKYLAEFTGSLYGDYTAVAAVFPHTVTPNYTKAEGASVGTLSLTLPNTIAWNDNGIEVNTEEKQTMQADNVMLAVYEDLNPDNGYKHGTTDDIHFYNVGGLFRLTLNNIPVGATKLVFTTDKKINGTFDVADLNPANTNTYPTISTPDPKNEPFSEGENSTTITFTTTTKACKKVFFIPVPVGSYQISFEVKDAEDKVLWSFGTSKYNTVLRGHMVKMPTLTFTKISGGGDGATNIIVTPTGFSGTVNLPSTNSSIYVKMNETTGGTINLEYSQSEGALKPENVYLQALGDIKALNINLPESHVELTGEENVHTITNVSANTSISTFVVDSNVKIGKDDDATTGLTIKGGSLNLQAPTQKVTIDIPKSAANKTAHKVQININSTIKTLAVERAAYTEKVADKIYVKLAPPVSETPTAITVEGINVKEKNCNLWVAKGVTVTSSVETKAAENTVAGEVATLTATDEGTIVNVTSEATVSQTSAANGATVIVEKGATVTNTNDNNGSGTIITGVDSESVAIVGSKSYKTLADAVTADTTTDGATITIIKAGEYDALPALTKTLTFVSSVDGVIINQTKNAEIDAEKTVTFKNIAFNLSDVQYLGFGKKSDSANGELKMEGCTIEGSLSLYGKSTFTDCKFTANGKYNIWAVLADASFNGCSFTNTNRAVNVYDFKHGSSVKKVSFSGCTFAGTEKKKAAINIHHNPDGTVAKYAVTITNCTTSGTWASSVAETGEPADATICNSALWMVSDIKNWTSGDITVTVDGVSQTIIDSSVAKIGDTKKYDTLAEAIDAVPANTPTTITMIANAMINVAGSALTVPTNKVITLDLNGFQVVGTAETGNTSELIRNNGTLTIKDSSDSNADGTGTGKLISGATPTWTWDGSNNYAGSYASNLIRNDGTLNVESGLIYNASTGSAAYAIDNYGAARITINGGAVDAKKASAIRLFYQNGGSIVVNGGIIGHYNDDNDRSYMALQVMGSAGKGVSVTLNGGEFYGRYSFYAGSGDKPWDTSLFTITGGLFGNESGFTGAISGDNISLVGGEFKAWIGSYNNDIDIIKGGVFHYDPSADVAEGYEAYQDGNLWKIRKIEGVAKIGTTTYATLAEAVAAVPTTGGEATTITMVADVANATGMSVAAGKNFTVDFNNHTYTLNKPGAGSAGTETIGFQLLQGSTITFKNGTINISEENLAKATIGNNIKRVIQNYANLTLDNMTIDGTNQYDKKDYVVSFNNGTSVIKDTKIKGADASKVIFDVCTWETYVATSVTVSGSSVIDGNIEVSASNNPQTLALTLTGGTHNGSLVMASGADKATITKSDSFSENAPEGYSWKSNDNGTSTLAANVAKIGESYYATLADAVAAVPENTKTTIQMIADETMADNTVISIPATKNIVLDLNGKTISSVGGSASAAYYFIQNRGTLEINDFSSGKNGKITSACTNPSPGYNYEYVTIYNIGGTLTLTAGTVETTSGGLSYAINNSSNAWGIGDDKETIFNMTGGTIISPSGDAGLRVYQNCAQNTNPFSHNTVNISGGTIASGGIFLDNFIYEPNVNTTGAGISTNVTISGGEIHGLIDVKLRHAFNTTFTITGGTFVDSKLWVRKHSEWKSVVAEPTAPLFFISGGNFSFTPNKAFGLAYDCSGTSWSSYTNPYSITGGTFNVDPSTYVANGYVATHKGNVWTVEEKLAAKIGTVGYASLSAALANVTKDAPLTWVDDEVWPDDTPVYYNGTFYATMAAAIEAVKNESANVDPNIYCKPNTTIPGGADHSYLTTSVTFFGNNATLNRNSEMDLGKYFTQEKDVTYKFYNLKKCGIWGTKNSDYTTTIEMANCQDVHEYLVQYDSGNGVVNGTISNCTFIYGNGYAAHMSGISQDCGGTLNISGCTFTNMPCGANIKNDAGNLAVTIKDCEFIDCGNTTSASAAGASAFAAAVRRGAKTNASGSFTMTGCTFTYSSGVEKALDTDIVIGENRTNNGEGVITYNISNTAASVKVYQVHASGVAATLKSEMTLKTSDVAEGNNE